MSSVSAPAIPPQLLLVVSRALQSLATPVIGLLIATASGFGHEAQDAISFCNVLFVGNLCAGFVVVATFGIRRIASDLRQLPPRASAEMLVFASLAALLSALIFTALETTTVTNAVLLARLGPVLFAVSSTILLRQRLRRGEWLGFALIGFGLLTTVLSGAGFALRRGDLLILISAVVFALVQLMSKRLLPQTGLPALVFARNFFSAIVFFSIAVLLYGPEHFMDAFTGPLWGIMMVYSLIVIVAAQFAWYRALQSLSPASVARWTVFTPALAVAYAFVLNGEIPTVQHMAALGFITVGIVVSSLGKRAPAGTSGQAESSLAAS